MTQQTAAQNIKNQYKSSTQNDDNNDDVDNNNNNNNKCKETGVQLVKKHWYEHVPKSVETSKGSKVTILWNQQVQPDRTIPNNKPDIIIQDNEAGTRMLIDVAISGDSNVIKKETIWGDCPKPTLTLNSPRYQN